MRLLCAQMLKVIASQSQPRRAVYRPQLLLLSLWLRER